MKKLRKVLIITNIPNPYRVPFFNELDRQFQQQCIELKVIFGALGYSRRKWQLNISDCIFNYEVLSPKMLTLWDQEKPKAIYRRLFRIINKEKPDLIVTVGFSLATVEVWLISWAFHTKYMIWSGSIENKGRSDSLFRKVQRKILAKRAAGFIAYGSKAKDYLIILGVASDKISVCPNTTDTEFYRVQTQNIRERINRDEIKHLLYIGHLTKKKRIDLLLYATKELLSKRSDFILEVVGSGPEMEQLKLLSRKLQIPDKVRFEGFKQKTEIPFYLAQADCFLFPSEYDIWGLALLEAMAAGLPCVASIHAGATIDLIKNGVTGFAVDFAETEKVAGKVHWILENPESSEKIGQNAKRYIQENFGLRKSAEAFVKATQSS